MFAPPLLRFGASAAADFTDLLTDVTGASTLQSNVFLANGT